MTNRTKKRIISLQSMGYLQRHIASELGLSQTEVRIVLREHYRSGNATPVRRKRTHKEELADAKQLMLKAGYDPNVIEANFG